MTTVLKKAVDFYYTETTELQSVSLTAKNTLPFSGPQLVFLNLWAIAQFSSGLRRLVKKMYLNM